MDYSDYLIADIGISRFSQARIAPSNARQKWRAFLLSEIVFFLQSNHNI